MSQQKQNPPYPEPPKPPEFKPQFKLYPYQYIGIPFIFLIPILALLGVFGETMRETDAASADLALHIEYPERSRYRLRNSLEVAITNETDSAIGELRVRFEKPLIDAFADVAFSQEPEAITDEYYEVVLEDVQPNETRVVSLNLQADSYFTHEGEITASADGIEPISETITVFVFP